MIISLPRRPSLPLPEPLRAAEPDTFTRQSVVVRLPEIGRQIVALNAFEATANAALERLIEEIPAGPVRLLTDWEAPDSADWADYIAPCEGWNWLDIPWFFAETYFYRRVLEGIGYFVPGRPHFGVDPFKGKKGEGLSYTRDRIQALLAGVDNLLAVEGAAPQIALARLLAAALWGNQADLSLWPAAEGNQPQHDNHDAATAHVLADETAAVVARLLAGKGQRVDMVMDNAGFELITDLCLTDFLLVSSSADSVRWHLKIHPTFVSDATISDVHETLAWLKADGDIHLADLGYRLESYLERGYWQLVDHPFWTSPRPMWQMPEGLVGEFGRSDLVIAKGDANYRRLLGDRHWPFTTPFEQIVSYFPAPLLALRTIKSEVAAGLTAEAVKRVMAKDPDWLINGRWGLIQFVGANI